jgi:hypothetical protein
MNICSTPIPFGRKCLLLCGVWMIGNGISGPSPSLAKVIAPQSENGQSESWVGQPPGSEKEPPGAANKDRTEEGKEENREEEPKGFPNLPLATLGGSQYWTDVCWISGWKIQRHATTHHHRLLDPEEVRLAWGSLEHCQYELRERIESQKIPPTRGAVVVLLHGLLRSNDSMDTLGEYLAEQGGYQIVNLAYASSREPVETHAADLASVIDQLGSEVTEINFVAHSLGNIVLRHYLGDLQRAGRTPDPRFKRLVMLAPPNQGSRVARGLAGSLVFQAVAGKCGVQLGAGWKTLSERLVVPPFPFGIIAGAQDETGSVLSPRDFTVFLDETRLTGAADFYAGPFFHWDIKYHPLAMEKTLHFLQFGRFDNAESTDSRQFP